MFQKDKKIQVKKEFRTDKLYRYKSKVTESLFVRIDVGGEFIEMHKKEQKAIALVPSPQLCALIITCFENEYSSVRH